MALSGPAALHWRHRDKNGQVSKKNCNTLIGTLRKTIGPISQRGAATARGQADSAAIRA